MRSATAASILFGLIVLAAPRDAHAIRILGHGTDKCSVWLRERDSDQKGEYREWFLGYLSASAYLKNQDVLRNMSYAQILQRIDEECERRPTKGLDEVLDDFFN
jgi:hypothetical protein